VSLLKATLFALRGPEEVQHLRDKKDEIVLLKPGFSPHDSRDGLTIERRGRWSDPLTDLNESRSLGFGTKL